MSGGRRLPPARAAAACALAALCACQEPPRAWAGRVTSRSQLIGGPRALGDLGDVRLSNGKVRFIVQALESHPGVQGSRAFGTFGGALLDADLARPDEERDPRTTGDGRDGLGELFPAFFLSAVEPRSLEILNDGRDGRDAHVRIEGDPAEFITATRFVDQAALGTGLHFVLDYQLGPDDDFLRLTASIENPLPGPHSFPIDQFPIPIGFIGLFGEGQPIFMTGEGGYDVRFGLERAYKRPYALPALGGLTSSIVAVDSQGVSYGLTQCLECKSPLSNAIPGGASFVQNHHLEYEKYAPVSPDAMLLPFVSGSLFGLYLGEVPRALPGGKAVSSTLKLRVGPPGAAWVIDRALGDQGVETGRLVGVVREEGTERPLPGAKVVVWQGGVAGGRDQRSFATSARADAEGRYKAQLPAGTYSLQTVLPGHDKAAPRAFSVRAGEETWIDPHVPRAAVLAVEVTDETGRRVPAKVTLDAAYDAGFANQDPKTFLYDLKVGEPYRPTDLVPDTEDPETRRFVETTLRAVDGRAQGEVRPGRWRVTVSRGPAYSIWVQEVELKAGEKTQLGAVVRRLLPARGRVAADLHVHSVGSVDSDVALDDRALSYAAEGIDFLVNTDHNFQVDLRPSIERTGLQDFLQSTTGVELSSLEAGHWNGYPLRWDPGPASHGAMPWFRRAPADLFADLRAHGVYGAAETVVQVNHPRDSVQGYFTAYGLTGDALTGDPLHDWPGKAGLFAPNGPEFGAGRFSDAFDAVEIFNGKRLDLLRTYRVPFPLPPPPIPKPCTDVPRPRPCTGSPGSIVREVVTRGALQVEEVAFPGALEDWEHLLDSGRRVTAVGNSDSHALLDGEAGYPRNLVDLGHPVESARAIDDREVARAIRAGRVLVTNGPELRLTVLDPLRTGADGKPLEVPVGDTVQPRADSTVDVHLVVEAAPWVDVTRGALLISKGPSCDESFGDCREFLFDVPPPAGAGVRRLDRVFANVKLPPGKDAWIAAWVSGKRTLWPVVIQCEVPPLLLNDAINALTGAFGITDPLGNLRPTQKGPFTPFALTNPVFVDGTGDGRWGAARAPLEPAAAPAAQRPLPPGVRAWQQGDSAQLVDLPSALRAWVERR